MTNSSKPSVLFVCVKNGGKSQMAAGLMRRLAGDTVDVHSAGTKPGAAVNSLSAEALLEIGVDITDQHPTLVDLELARDADLVVTLGREAHLDPLPGTRIENWDTDEPSERGIDGIERMRLIRDDINERVRRLYEAVTGPTTNPHSSPEVVERAEVNVARTAAMTPIAPSTRNIAP